MINTENIEEAAQRFAESADHETYVIDTITAAVKRGEVSDSDVEALEEWYEDFRWSWD